MIEQGLLSLFLSKDDAGNSGKLGAPESCYPWCGSIVNNPWHGKMSCVTPVIVPLLCFMQRAIDAIEDESYVGVVGWEGSIDSL